MQKGFLFFPTFHIAWKTRMIAWPANTEASFSYREREKEQNRGKK